MKRKVYTDGNGSRLITVEGLGEYIPLRDFKKQQQEISELKAQISLIKRLADGLMDSKSGIDYSGKMDGLLDAIDKTPPQCIASVKADAFDEYAKSWAAFGETKHYIGTTIDEVIEDILNHANKLREQK